MDNKPLVSIIIPTYNRGDYLPYAIDSVINQTYGKFELIVIDDGSTDNTANIMKTYNDDKRVTYLYQDNQGQSIARNKALSSSSGSLICFLDSDNIWPENKLELSIQAMRDYPEASIIYGDCITIDEAGRELSRDNMKRYSGYIPSLLLKDNFISMNTTMTKRECFDDMGGMSGSRKVADDYDLWLRFSSKYRFKYIPEYLVYYRVMPNQISSNKKLRFETNEAIILDFLDNFPDAVTRNEAREGLSSFYRRKARYFTDEKDKPEAFGALKRAFHYEPLSAKTWRCALRTAVYSTF